METRAGKVSLVLNIILVCTCIVLATVCFSNHSYSMNGTYCTGDGLSEGDVYLVLQADGIYVLYRQFEPLEKGQTSVAHAIKGADVLYLTPDNGVSHLTAVCSLDEVFLLGSEQGDLLFKKLSKDAVYVNIPDASFHPTNGD